MLNEAMADFLKQLVNKESLISSIELHKHGINVRHMGKLRFMSNNLLKNVIVGKMIARTIKNVLRGILRIGGYNGNSKAELQIQIVNWLNTFIASNNICTTTTTTTTTTTN